MPLLKQVIVGLWSILLIAGLGFYVRHSEQFTAANIAQFLHENSHFILLTYLIMSVMRAFVLIPSTPFVLAGSLILSDKPFHVLAISLLSIVLSAWLIYGFSGWLGLKKHFEKLSPRVTHTIETALNSRWGLAYLIFWSFFPLAPTDAACYIAGVLRMNVWKFLLGVFLGELVICSFYIFIGQGFWEVLFG